MKGGIVLDSQLKRGIIDICVLCALKNDDSYGYKIIKDLSPHIDISESTLYPILKRLESVSCVQTYKVVHNGRLRKYYRITSTGKDRIHDFLKDWESVKKAYNYIEGVCRDD